MSPNPGLAEYYRISVGNVLRVMLPDRGSAYSGNYVVEEDGDVFLPPLGAVRVEGLTVPEVRTMLRKRYQEAIGGDEVVLTILPYFTATVVGEVRSSGNFLMAAGATPLTAIAAAGGFDDRADRAGIYVLRGDRAIALEPAASIPATTSEGRASDAMVSLGSTVLQSGDAVVVPRQALSWITPQNLLFLGQFFVGVVTLIKVF